MSTLPDNLSPPSIAGSGRGRAVARHGGRWRQYLELTKPKVTLLIVFTALVGMMLAAPGWVPLRALLFGTLGIALASGSAAAFNHVFDRHIDEQMARTSHRPLPMGSLSKRAALGFAALLAVASMAVLGPTVGTLTAVLTFASLIGYAIVYTLWLKHATPQNIVIGGAAGAAPPVLSGLSGLIYLVAMLALNARFLHHVIMLRRHASARPELALRAFRYSITYLLWLFAALLVDHYVSLRL